MLNNCAKPHFMTIGPVFIEKSPQALYNEQMNEPTNKQTLRGVNREGAPIYTRKKIKKINTENVQKTTQFLRNFYQFLANFCHF